MDAHSSPKTSKSASMEPSNSKSPSKSGHSRATSSSVRILESQEIAALSPSPPTGQGRQSQAGQPHPEAGAPPVRRRAAPRHQEKEPSCAPAHSARYDQQPGSFPLARSLPSTRKRPRWDMLRRSLHSPSCKSTRRCTPRSTPLPVLALHTTA